MVGMIWSMPMPLNVNEADCRPIRTPLILEFTFCATAAWAYIGTVGTAASTTFANARLVYISFVLSNASQRQPARLYGLGRFQVFARALRTAAG
jgi:hypothetical protein